MTKPKDGSGVSEENYIPVEEDKLKDEQKAELDKALEAYKRECLKSFSATRGCEVVKKFDFPTLQSLMETQHENKMLDMVHQAMGHAFVIHAPVMTQTVHNAVIKTLREGMFQGYSGPCYMQPGQMSFTPMGSTAAMVPSASFSRPEGRSGPTFSQLPSTTLPLQTDPVFTNSPPITTSVQGGSASGFMIGWDLVTGFGMPP